MRRLDSFIMVLLLLALSITLAPRHGWAQG